MSHLERNLKIEYKKRLIQQSYGYTPVGDGVPDVPWLVARRIIRYPYTARLHNIAKKINPRHSPKRDVEGAVPYNLLQVLPPQNRSALCGLYVVQEDSKAVQI